MSYNNDNGNNKKIVKDFILIIVIICILGICLWYIYDCVNKADSHFKSNVNINNNGILLKDERYKNIEDPIVLNRIGHSYLYNEEYDKALPFIVKAADKGYFRAQNSLGCMYLDGMGLDVDYEMAMFWFKESAKQGHPKAIINIGIMYENGYGVEKDYKKALELYEKAAQLGYPKAQQMYDRLKSKI